LKSRRTSWPRGLAVAEERIKNRQKKAVKPLNLKLSYMQYEEAVQRDQEMGITWEWEISEASTSSDRWFVFYITPCTRCLMRTFSTWKRICLSNSVLIVPRGPDAVFKIGQMKDWRKLGQWWNRLGSCSRPLFLFISPYIFREKN